MKAGQLGQIVDIVDVGGIGCVGINGLDDKEGAAFCKIPTMIVFNQIVSL